MQAVAEGLANAAGAITGLRSYPFPVESPSPPCVIVRPQTLPYDLSYSQGIGRGMWIVRLLVGRGEERAAWKLLNGYCAATGDLSVKAAIEGASDLSDWAQSVRVTDVSSFAAYEYGEVFFVGCEFTVDVIPL